MNRPEPTIIQHTDETVNRIQRAIIEPLQFLMRLPTNAAQVMRAGLQLSTGDTRVAHGLGRTPQGWFVVRNNANTTIWEATASTDPKTFLNLRASGACTVTVIFF